MRIFLTGGTGLIGRHVVERLLARGDEVVALTRRPEQAPSKPGVQWLGGDPTVAGPWLEQLDSVDAVIHLAGEPVMGARWNPKFKLRLRDSRVLSTGLIANRLAKQPRRTDGTERVLVSASAIGYYGPRGDEEVDEQTPPGSGFLEDLSRDWENATEPARQAGLRVVQIRIGIVLDPAGGALPKLIRPFWWFVGGPIGSGKQWMSWIHRDDVVGMILFALDRSEIRGPMNGTAPEPVTNWGFCKTLGKVIGRPSWLPAPKFILRLLLGESARVVTSGQRVIPRVAMRHGFGFRFPQLEGALRDLLQRPAKG